MQKKCKANLSRLKELRRMLNKHDEIFKTVKFDISCWYKLNECGTAGCALGSACLYAPFMKLGLGINYSTNEPRLKGLETTIGDGFYIGSQFFGLSMRESEYLFDPEQYMVYHIDDYAPQTSEDLYVIDRSLIDAKLVAKRVGVLIKHYSKFNKPLYKGR